MQGKDENSTVFVPLCHQHSDVLLIVIQPMHI